jgi:hypothetical protein
MTAPLPQGARSERTEAWRTSDGWRPPPALVARLDALVDAYDTGGSGADRYLGIAERVLGRLLQNGCLARDAALDLLAADALVTYAFEAASSEPEALAERAAAAMRRISALGAAATPCPDAPPAAP